MKTRKPLSILLTLALVLGLLPWSVMPARAETAPTAIGAETTNWSGEMSASDDVIIGSGGNSAAITAADGTTLTIAEGKTLTVNGTITVGGGSGTLTVKGPGKLAINGGNGSVSVGAGGAGGSGVKGNLTVTGGTLTVTGGSGGYGSSAGGAGGDGVSGKVTVNGGELTVTGGRGGGSSFTGGSGGVGVSGDVIVNSGSAAITGGVGGCTSESGAGGVGVSGKVTVNGGELTVTGGSGGDSSTAYNDCFGGAGGVGIGENGTVTLAGGTLTVAGGSGGTGNGNEATGGGGGVGIGENGTVTLAGGTLTVNGGAGGTAGGSSGAAGKAFGDNAGVTVEDGCGYTDGTNVYTESLTDAQIEELNGKTLRPCEAKLGENGYYPTLAEAFGAANNGATVTLLADVKTDTSLTVAAGKDFTLDLNGHTIDRGLAGKDSAVNGSVITVSDTLTLTDSSQDKTGTITGGNTAGKGGGVYVAGGGAFTMEGGTISGNTANYGGGVFVNGDGTFRMSGGTICGNTATNGGGVYVDNNGAFTMEDGTISGNTATDGGGVYENFSALGFTMEGGTISGNTATNGGGVYTKSFAGFEMTGGVITGNNAGEDGGGVVYHYCNITVGGSAVISGNVKGGAKGENGVYAGGTANNALMGTDSDVSVFKPIIVGSPLKDGARIGVTMPPSFADSAFTSGWSTRMSGSGKAPADFFTSDLAERLVLLNANNEAVIAALHLNRQITAPVGSVLVLAVYDGTGRLDFVRSVTLERDCIDVSAETLLALEPGYLNTLGSYKLMLLDGKTYAPLCEAWEG